MACMKALKILLMTILFCKIVQPYVRNAAAEKTRSTPLRRLPTKQVAEGDLALLLGQLGRCARLLSCGVGVGVDGGARRIAAAVTAAGRWRLVARLVAL